MSTKASLFRTCVGTQPEQDRKDIVLDGKMRDKSIYSSDRSDRPRPTANTSIHIAYIRNYIYRPTTTLVLSSGSVQGIL